MPVDTNSNCAFHVPILPAVICLDQFHQVQSGMTTQVDTCMFALLPHWYKCTAALYQLLMTQTQSGRAGYMGRQLCIGAWTLLSPTPDVMVVQDALTDFRYD